MSSEYTIPFDLTKSGLRRSYRNPRNTSFLTRCLNVKPTEWGLVPFEAFKLPWELDIRFPFPQLFHGKFETLLADRDVLYRVSPEDFSVAPVTTYDAYSPDAEKAILPGNSWHFMDFHHFWALYNGHCIVFSTNTPGISHNIFVVDDIHIETACAFHGRALIGGFDPENFWNTGWRELWNEWQTLCPAGAPYNDYMGENFVLWSSIGQSDMALMWLVYPEIALRGYIDTLSGDVHGPGVSRNTFPHYRSLLKESFARNEWGFAPMPWQGRVLCLKPLGNAVIVYGEGGVSALIPASSPIPTFGLKEIVHPIGIASRSSIHGDDRGHIFIDANGKLQSIGTNLEVGELDFEEYLNPLLEDEIMISHNPLENEYYISGKEKSFLLTQSGLCEISPRVTSCQVIRGETIGVYEQSGSERVEVWSDTFNGGQAIGTTVKTTMVLRVTADSFAGLQGAFKYRYSRSAPFSQTDWEPINDEGFVTIPTGGIEFQWGVKGNPRTIIGIDHVEATIRIDDKRSIRGPYGDTAI